MTYEVNKSEAEWRAQLDANQYAVLREAATERPWSGPLLDEDRDGLYRCAACGAELFKSGTKFDSGCGWPSFYATKGAGTVDYIEDRSHGMMRIEVRCHTCGSHLGHVFEDGPAPTGQRYCMNSISLDLRPPSDVSDDPA